MKKLFSKLLNCVPNKDSLQWRLIASFMFVIFLILLVILWGMSFLIKEHLLHVKQDELIRKGLEIANYIQKIEGLEDGESINDAAALQIAEYVNFVDNYIDARIWVIDTQKRVMVISSAHRGMMGRPPMGGQEKGKHEGMMMPRPPDNGKGKRNLANMEAEAIKMLLADIDLANTGKRQVKVIENPYYKEQMVVVAVPFYDAAGKTAGAVLLNAPLFEIAMFMRSIYYYLALAGILGVLLSLLLVSRLTKRIVNPLQVIQEATEEIAKGNYEVVVPVSTSDEVGRLGNAVNYLVRELSNYMAEVNKLEQLRRDFVANVSHELRTPLTIIRGYTEALSDGTIEGKEQSLRYIGQMREETMRLERLIKELLDLSKLQSESVALSMEYVPLNALVKSVVNMLQQKAKAKGVAIDAVYCDKEPRIFVNADRIVQLILILLDNAVKYTEENGRVCISTVLIAENTKNEQNVVVLQVKDTGIGVSDEDLPYIFERFYKADKAHSRADSGVGLGLAIAKQIVLLHHGVIEAKSEKDIGSEFTVKFIAEKLSK